MLHCLNHEPTCGCEAHAQPPNLDVHSAKTGRWRPPDLQFCAAEDATWVLDETQQNFEFGVRRNDSFAIDSNDPLIDVEHYVATSIDLMLGPPGSMVGAARRRSLLPGSTVGEVHWLIADYIARE